MGASKTYQYSDKEIHSAQIARALAHPARIRILSLIKNDNFVRNVDLAYHLQLVPSTINAHLKKLCDADLIEMEFMHNCYLIRLKYESYDEIPFFFDNFN